MSRCMLCKLTTPVVCEWQEGDFDCDFDGKCDLKAEEINTYPGQSLQHLGINKSGATSILIIENKKS